MSVPDSNHAPSADLFARYLAAARNGSRADLGQLLNECRQYLLLVANAELDADLAPKFGASDLVQETFLEAQRDFPQFTGDSEHELLAWLKRILLNTLCDAARHYRQTDKRRIGREVRLADPYFQPRSELRSQVESPSRLVRQREQQHHLQAALHRLPVEYREVIALRNLQALPFAVVGHRMGRSEEAARKLWGRAVHALSRDLKGRYEYEP